MITESIRVIIQEVSNHARNRSMQPHIAVNKPLLPSKSVLDSEDERSKYYTRFTKAWTGSNRRMAQLGSNPVSLSKPMMASLKNHEHVVGLKSDGVRYALYMCLRIDGSPIALMIDRAKNMYEVEVLATEDYFLHESIFEGELVWKKPDEVSNVFLVFDVVRLKGELMTNRPFTERLDMVERCTRLSEDISQIADSEEIETRVAETDVFVLMSFTPPIAVKPKRFVSVDHVTAVWESRAESQHRVDGLVIHRCDAPYRNGSAFESIYKWKPDHSIDLIGCCGRLRHAEGCFDDTTFENMKIVVMPSRVLSSDEEVTEYHIDVSEPNKLRLFAMRTRPDKRFPNSLVVIRATVQDCIDNVQPEDIARCVEDLKSTCE